MGASDIGFGGLPLLQPSQTCTRYLRNSTVVIPEKAIRIGARYRTRKNLAEHVSLIENIFKENGFGSLNA